MEDATAAVREVVATIAKRGTDTVSVDTRLAEDLGMKSVSRIELAALLEDRFGITISNFDVRRPQTVQEVVDLVASRL